MSLALVALLTVSAVSPPAAARPRLLVLDLRDDGAGPEIVRLLRDSLTTQISRENIFEVLSTEDVRRLVDLETQKVATCKVDEGDGVAACLAEIGSALGARYIVYGNVGALGSATLVNLTLADSEKNVNVARALVQVDSRERVPDEVGRAMHAMLIEAGMVAPDKPSSLPWIIGGATGVVIGGGLLAVGVASALGADTIVADTSSPKDVKDAAEGARTGWIVGAAVGSVVAVAGASLIALPFVME